MIKKLLFILFAFIAVKMSAQTTHNISWGFNSNPSQPTTAPNYTNKTIAPGDTVVWTWVGDGGSHNVVSLTGGSETFSSGATVSTGGNTFSHTFNNVGFTDFVCQPHSGNMFGRITVETLSTPQFKTLTKFSIFPNPGKNELNISLPSLANEGLQLEVYDVLGKKVYAEILNALTFKINIAKWNSGFYLVRLTSSTKAITLTKRFVKL